MSREINNREYRQKVIKDLLTQLHEGKTAEEVKSQFEQAFSGVSASEISEAEQALIEGGLPVQEVQKLCDVHAAVFKGSIEQIHEEKEDPAAVPGHPVHTLRAENRAIEQWIELRIRPHLEGLIREEKGVATELLSDLEQLKTISAHYSRKENLLFPYLEQRGITAPPKVMWGVDDEIRTDLKDFIDKVEHYDGDAQKLVKAADDTLKKIEEMIFKEENILIPMLLDVLAPSQWQAVEDQSDELGYCLIEVPPKRKVKGNGDETASEEPQFTVGDIVLPTGAINIAELTGLLNTLPVDITFVGKDDTVKYFSQGAERIFPRTKAIIGRKVVNCHPPASAHIVEGIVSDLKSGKKDHEDFFIQMGGKYIYIRYFAVRDADGTYLGTLEVTQNIAPIQLITGEKRLVTD